MSDKTFDERELLTDDELDNVTGGSGLPNVFNGQSAPRVPEYILARLQAQGYLLTDTRDKP